MSHRKLLENVYFIPGFTNIGLIKSTFNGENCIYLIDSGPDRNAAQEIEEELKKMFPEGYKISAVINTHGHSDHVGGNNFFQTNYDCQILIPEKEEAISKNLCSNINYIWGGKAIPELTIWYSLKEGFKATKFIKAGDEIKLSDGAKISFTKLYGHSIEQLGVLYTSKEGKTVFFTGDAYLGLDELCKSKISFQEQTYTALKTMKELLTMKCDFFVQSHGIVPATDDEVQETVSANIRALEKTIAYIKYLLNKKNHTTETIVSKIINKFSIGVKAVNYALIYSTTKSLLSELHEENEINIKLKEGFFYWSK